MNSQKTTQKAFYKFSRKSSLLTLTQFSVLCDEEAVAWEALAGVGAKRVHTVTLSSTWVILTFIYI